MEIKTIQFQTSEISPSDNLSEEYDKEQESIQKQNKIRQSGIPEDYQYGFNDFMTESAEQTKFLQTVRNCFNKWTEGKPVTVCLLGDNGIGKTRIGNAFLIESLNYTKKVFDLPVHYSIRYKLLDDIRQEYDRCKSFTEKKTQNQVIAEYSDFDLLVLDEIGLGDSLETQKLVLFKIMNERDLKKKTTILISNFSFKEFAEFSGRATMDRFKNTAVFPRTEGLKSFRGLK